jgi:hypothetical protein
MTPVLVSIDDFPEPYAVCQDCGDMNACWEFEVKGFSAWCGGSTSGKPLLKLGHDTSPIPPPGRSMVCKKLSEISRTSKQRRHLPMLRPLQGVHNRSKPMSQCRGRSHGSITFRAPRDGKTAKRNGCDDSQYAVQDPGSPNIECPTIRP